MASANIGTIRARTGHRPERIPGVVEDPLPGRPAG